MTFAAKIEKSSWEAFSNIRAFSRLIPRPSLYAVLLLLIYYTCFVPLLCELLCVAFTEPVEFISRLTHPGTLWDHSMLAISSIYQESSKSEMGGFRFTIAWLIAHSVGSYLYCIPLAAFLLFLPDCRKKWHVFVLLLLVLAAVWDLNSDSQLTLLLDKLI